VLATRLVFKRSVIHFVREDDEFMKPPSNVKTPAQYIASLPADRAKTIATVRALVNKHIPRGYDDGEEARHGEVLRSFRVAGGFAARSDWQVDLGDFKREVDRDVRTIALDDQGGAGADGEARRPIGEQGGRQARRHKASAVKVVKPNYACDG
jgi:hypothetical protein